MIHIQQLEKSYGRLQVLRDINISLAAGHIYGLVGKNGAGKTTLFQCLAQAESYGGTIKSPWPKLRQHVCYLPTEPYFMSMMTGEEYLRLVCHAQGVSAQSIADSNIFSLPLKAYASSYSSGMKKQLAITGLILQDREVWLLDEPFNGLDLQSNMWLTQLITQLKKAGKTLLISSHIIDSLSKISDSIFMLDDGRVAQHFHQGEYHLLEAQLLSSCPKKIQEA